MCKAQLFFLLFFKELFLYKETKVETKLNFSKTNFLWQIQQCRSVKGTHWLILAQLAENFSGNTVQWSVERSWLWCKRQSQFGIAHTGISICNTILEFECHMWQRARTVTSHSPYALPSCSLGVGAAVVRVGVGGVKRAKPCTLPHNNKTSRSSWPIQPDPQCTAGSLAKQQGGHSNTADKKQSSILPS